MIFLYNKKYFELNDIWPILVFYADEKIQHPISAITYSY